MLRQIVGTHHPTREAPARVPEPLRGGVLRADDAVEDGGVEHAPGHHHFPVHQNGRHPIDAVVGVQHALPGFGIFVHVIVRKRNASLRKKLFRVAAVASYGVAVNDNLGHRTPFCGLLGS